MKILKGFAIVIGLCLLLDLGFIGAMQESQEGISTIKDNLEFVYSLAILIIVGLFIRKITSKIRKNHVVTNGKRKETVKEMYARTYSQKNSYFKKQNIDDISCVYCNKVFSGRESTHYNVACDTITCPYCDKQMKVNQKVEYTSYAIN